MQSHTRFLCSAVILALAVGAVHSDVGKPQKELPQQAAPPPQQASDVGKAQKDLPQQAAPPLQQVAPPLQQAAPPPQQEAPPRTVILKTDAGTFVLSNPLALTAQTAKPGRGELACDITNQTGITWSRLELWVKLYRQATSDMDVASVLPVAEFMFKLDGMKKGEKRHVTAPPLNPLLLSQEPVDLGAIIRWEADALTSERYVFTLVKPAKSKQLRYQDSAISVSFSVEQSQISFTLRNRTSSPLKLDWSQVSYVDCSGKAHKVMHSGVRYVERNSAQPPTVIPPGANIDDLIAPSDYVSETSKDLSSGMREVVGYWQHDALFPGGRDAVSYKGKTFSVFMPLYVKGKLKNYMFTFKIADVQT